MKKLLLLFGVAVTLMEAQTVSISWQEVTALMVGRPAGTGFQFSVYDPIGHQHFFFVPVAASNTIYGTDTFFYKASSKTWTDIGGYGDFDNTPACLEDDGPTFPRPRHPTAVLVDTLRGLAVMFSGVCQGSYPTPPAVWRLGLNADPSTDTWTMGPAPTHFPRQNNNQSWVHDAVHDVYFWYGYDGTSGDHNTWMYCPSGTSLTACSGHISDFVELSSVGQPGNLINPTLIAYNGDIYILGGQGAFHITKYNVVSQSFTALCGGCTVPADAISYIQAAAYIGSGTILYHAVGGSSAPSDWIYSVGHDTLTQISSSGPKAVTTAAYTMSYDDSIGAVVMWSQSASDVHMWHGTISFPTPPPTGSVIVSCNQRRIGGGSCTESTVPAAHGIQVSRLRESAIGSVSRFAATVSVSCNQRRIDGGHCQ